MKKLFLLLLLILPVSFLSAQEKPSDFNWVQLFNGKDLNNWQVKIAGYNAGENYGNTFRVEDGKMKVSYDQYDNFGVKYGHLFYKQKFSWYIIAVEYRFTGEQAKGGQGWATLNSGVMVHGQDPKTMTKDQDFPISIEVQLLGGLGSGERSTANLCTPGTNVVMNGKLFTPHCINSKSKTYNGDEWVRVEVMVLGDSLIRHKVNGEMVLEYTKPQIGGGNVLNADPTVKIDGKLLEAGYISLQSESHPVEFRKVELVNLKGCKDPTALNYHSYYLKEDNSICVYKKGKPKKGKLPVIY
jgi:Domain of Unknown Function (DUF1080)